MVEGMTDKGTTKDRIIEAALDTLKEEGFAGTSARAIARRGDFNQALIFYHFGTLNDLLLAALDRTSIQRLQRYREALPGAETVEDKVRVATELYREDLETGHVTVISEMIAGSLARPDLGPEVVARMDPWIDFAEEAFRDVLAETGLESLVPARTAAYAIVALSLGIDLLAHLGRDDIRAEALFEFAGHLGQILGPLLRGGTT
jgi:AcrR family transcriptional regulator